VDREWPCNHQDLPLNTILPGVPGQLPCLFDLTADNREMKNIAPDNLQLVHTMWDQLNRSVLTSYLHGASGPAGNPGGIPRCSPAKLLGPCNPACAKAFYSKWGYPAADEPVISDSNDNGHLAMMSAAAKVGSDQCSMTLLPGKAFRGKDKLLIKLNASTPTECCTACSENRDCSTWTYNPGSLDAVDLPCHLKTGPDEAPVDDPACTSGSKDAPRPAVDCPKVGEDSNFPVCN